MALTAGSQARPPGRRTKLHRHPAQRDGLLRGLGLRDRAAIEIIAVTPDEVVRLAAATGLTA